MRQEEFLIGEETERERERNNFQRGKIKIKNPNKINIEDIMYKMMISGEK